MAQIDKGHHFLSGFGNEDFLEEFSMGRNSEPTPVINISENSKRFKLELGVPGFKKEELAIEVDDLDLIVMGERQGKEEEAGERIHKRGISNSNFRRIFRLPNYAKNDEITASHTDGILQILIPKGESDKKSSVIKIG